MAKIQSILLGLGIIGIIIGAILIGPIVFLSFIGAPCPFLPPDIQIDIHRNGSAEWLPVVKELESFVPTFVPSLPPSWYEGGGYTINITDIIEQYHQGSPGTVVKGSYNMIYDSHNSSDLHEFIHDLTFNESAWRYWEFDPPYWNLSWIYHPSEYDTNFQYEAITDPSNFKAKLEQYLLNFSTTLAEQEAFLYAIQELAFDRSRRTCLLTHAMGADFPRLGRLLLTTTTGRVVAIMLIYFQWAIAD